MDLLVRPQHLRDLTSNKDTGPALVTSTSLTAFINLLMMGKCPSSVTAIFWCQVACRSEKARRHQANCRLAAKCVNKYALNALKDTFNLSQLGVDVSEVCEAAIPSMQHADLFFEMIT